MVGMKHRDPYDQQEPEAPDTEARDLMREQMSTERGRQFVSLVLSLSECQTQSFSTNALQMAFNEGRRSAGLRVLSLIESDDYCQLLKESNERRIRKHR